MLSYSYSTVPCTMPSLLLILQLCTLSLLLPLLTSTAASPVQVPNLQQCQLASDTAVMPPIFTLQQNCCLPVQQPIKFSFASYTPQTHVRRRAQKASEDYIAQYQKAYELMKALPDDDPRSFSTQAKIHCAFCNGAYNQIGADGVILQVHFSWLFLPWHRWYLYFHERILASLLGDPDFSLLFWNWDDQQDGGNVLPDMFARNGTSLYDEKRNPAHQPPALVLLSSGTTSTNNSVIINANLNAMYQGLVTANYPGLFMGGVFRTGTNLRNSTVLTAPIGGSLENGVHNAIHFWTGNPNLPLIADMGTFLNASRDPVFYAHHSNVDRLWEVWRTLAGGNRQDHTDPDFLDAEFYFYDENAQLVTVTVRDALDNSKLGISYEEVSADELWINYSPPAITSGSAVAAANAIGTPVVGPSPENGTIDISTSGLTALVARPSGAKPNNTEEVLTIQGVQVSARTSFVSLDVFVNLLNATNTTAHSSAEYVGTFNIVPSGSPIMTNVKLEIGDNLQRIGIDNDNFVVITLAVTRKAQEINETQEAFTLTILGLQITYESNS